MATCGSLRHIFENTISENNSSSSTSSLIDSLSPWKQIKTLKPPLDHSFTEIFGELHFKENHSNPTPPPPPSSFFTPTSSSSSSSFFTPTSSSFFAPPPTSSLLSSNNDNQKDEKSGSTITSFSTNDGYTSPYQHRRSDSFSSLNSESLQFCTEGLGSESLDDAEDLMIPVHNKDNSNMQNNMGEKVHARRHSGDCYCRKNKTMFPPPIPYIGQTGKPAVSFQSFRKDGRFVLKEVRIPTQECLQASREDGRLRLSFVQPNSEDEDDDHDGNGNEDDDGDDEVVGDDDDDDVYEDDGGEEEGDDEEEGEVEEVGDGVKEEDAAKVKDEFVRSYS